MLMKTIKILKNITQINLQLPKKQYSKEKNLMMNMKRLNRLFIGQKVLIKLNAKKKFFLIILNLEEIFLLI